MPARLLHATLDRVYRLPRRAKTALALGWDTGLLCLVFLLANSLRRGEFWSSIPLQPRQWGAFAVALAVALIGLWMQGFYRSVVRYSSYAMLASIGRAVSASAVVLAVLLKLISVSALTVAGIYWGFALLGITLPRILIRLHQDEVHRKNKTPVFVYGAGSAGRQLVWVLRVGEHYDPVAYLDDDPRLARQQILGLTVFAPNRLAELVQRFDCHTVLLAMGRISHARKKQILDVLEPLGVEVRSIPEFADIVSGRARLDDLREIPIEDILGRDPVDPDPELMPPRIRGKAVMVTGAGGSIGSELCRQIIKQAPACLLLLELSEYALYAIERELRPQAEAAGVRLVPYLGNVQDEARIEAILRAEGIHTVFHAAAYKHVPLVEFNVVEGVKNNVLGTWRTARAARAAGVECFVLISTDKAVRPTNTMGASKRMAELGLQALAREAGATVFCMVRFGNVLGSSGSVVPLFREQIRRGGPVTVTHPEIIRYFMTIPEAAQLVIQAGSLARGGEVFVLDMGEPVKIYDLARRMIHLAGREVKDDAHPHGDIEIRFSGLRPGEKLYEELLIGDAARTTRHPRILAASEKEMPPLALEAHLQAIEAACRALDPAQLRQLLLTAPTDFTPVDALCDALHLAGHAAALSAGD